MRTNRAALALAGGLSLASAAVALLDACSDNGNSGSGSSLPLDSGAKGTDANAADSAPDDDGSTGETDAGTDCATPPKLHPPKADGGIFCPYSGVDGGKNIYCAITDTCCETPDKTTPSSCVSGKTTTCPVAKSTPWQCEDPADCAGGQKCCAYAQDGGAVTVKTDTCGPYLSHFAGTRCADTCAAGELVVCEEQSACSNGTCTAVKPKGNAIGVCN